MWNKKQENYLINNYKKMTHTEIGKKLNKSQYAVRTKAHRLELKKRIRYYIQPHHKRITTNLSYILGAIKGDGCIHDKRKSIFFGVIDKDFILNFKKAVEEQFGIDIRIGIKKYKKKEYQDEYTTGIYKADIYRFIKDFDLNKILKASKPIKCAFLRGIYDAEGCIIMGKNKIPSRITFTNTDKLLIIFIEKLLNSFNIEYKIQETIPKNRKHKTKQIILISRKENLIKFANNIGFSIKRKQDRLEIMPVTISERPRIHGRFTPIYEGNTGHITLKIL